MTDWDTIKRQMEGFLDERDAILNRMAGADENDQPISDNDIKRLEVVTEAFDQLERDYIWNRPEGDPGYDPY